MWRGVLEIYVDIHMYVCMLTRKKYINDRRDKLVCP